MSGFVDLLKKRFEESLPEKGRHYMNNIADSARQMGTLIDDLLDFSRTGRQEMRQEDLDMNIILKEALEELDQDTNKRKIEWIIPELPPAHGDHSMMKLVWANLLGNAVKFTRTRKKARIEAGAEEKDDEIIYFVKDNGAGFDMKYVHKLFGVFQRLHSTEEFEGTGVGLANVRRIITRHGGRTWAESELDKGAAFYFSLPKRKEMHDN
jgi:light-regulated signal transduction histidine kinase (bacteriophytochrome)